MRDGVDATPRREVLGRDQAQGRAHEVCALLMHEPLEKLGPEQHDGLLVGLWAASVVPRATAAIVGVTGRIAEVRPHSDSWLRERATDYSSGIARSLFKTCADDGHIRVRCEEPVAQRPLEPLRDSRLVGREFLTLARVIAKVVELNRIVVVPVKQLVAPLYDRPAEPVLGVERVVRVVEV